LGSHGRRWVTYDVPQVAALLRGEKVVHAFHPTTKNVVNAVRNYGLARRVFKEHAVDRVISTGAAVAVPFMIRARQLGISCHYIESATRVTGPSLSGRIVARLPGVHLYRQMGDWGAPHWRPGPCVFDEFRVSSAEDAGGELQEAGPPRRVFVSLGTHHFPFTALVERLRGLAAPDIHLVWQLGATPPPAGGLPGRVVGQLAADEFRREIEDADVVVGHAGVGLTLTSLSAGKVPVLVPRRRARREHTDDHQVQLARALQHRGLAVAAGVGELSLEQLAQAARRTVVHVEPPPFHLVTE